MLCKLGGYRMQLSVSDLSQELQKLDSKNEANLYRKQHGNLLDALKYLLKNS